MGRGAKHRNPTERLNTNSLALELGLLESGAQVDLRLLVLDASNPERPGIEATTSLAGLPRPFVTRQSLSQRLEEKFALPVTLFFIVFLAYGGATRLRENWGSLLTKPPVLP